MPAAILQDLFGAHDLEDFPGLFPRCARRIVRECGNAGIKRVKMRPRVGGSKPFIPRVTIIGYSSPGTSVCWKTTWLSRPSPKVFWS